MLYYARLVDPKMLRAINEKLRVHSKPTRDTNKKAIMLLGYAATYPNESIHYKASNMVLHMDSDAVYLTIP